MFLLKKFLVAIIEYFYVEISNVEASNLFARMLDSFLILILIS